jgi:hypothetical protein
VLGIILDCYLLSGKMSCLRPSGKNGKVFLWKQDSTSMVRKGMVIIIGNTGVSVTNAHMSTETGESIQHRFRAGNPNNAEHGGVSLVVPRKNLQPPFHTRRNSTRNKSEVINSKR